MIYVNIQLLTINAERDSLADGRRYVVAGDAEEHSHLLAVHLPELQRAPVERVDWNQIYSLTL